MKQQKNILEIDGYNALISYDPEIEMFRGEFLDLNGGADFYASSVDGLKDEARQSLKVFLEMCAEDGVEPRKSYSGRFNVRLEPQEHQRAVITAAAQGISLNQLVAKCLNETFSHA